MAPRLKPTIKQVDMQAFEKYCRQDRQKAEKLQHAGTFHQATSMNRKLLPSSREADEKRPTTSCKLKMREVTLGCEVIPDD